MQPIEKNPIQNVKAVHLHQTIKNVFKGTLKVSMYDECPDLELPVTVTYDPGKRIWVRVQVEEGIADKEHRRRVSRKLASNALTKDDSRWRYLATDWRDGEVAFSATFSCDLTDDAVNRFFALVISFLEENWAELNEIINPEQQASKENELTVFDFGDLV